MSFKRIIATIVTAGLMVSIIPSTAMAATVGWNGSDKDGWRYYTTSSSYVKNSWKQISGKWYYFNSDGIMESNSYRDGCWLSSSGAWDTRYSKGTWKQDYKGWWFTDNGWYPKDQWLWINGNRYYFNSNGYMESNGYRDGCWLTSSGAWDTRYSKGTWKQDSKGWWYTDNGWYPKDQWLWIDGSRYYFNSSGYRETDSYRDGCWLTSSGAWDTRFGNGTWKQDSRGWWFDDNGWYPKNQWLRIDGTNYWFDSNGYWNTSGQKKPNVTVKDAYYAETDLTGYCKTHCRIPEVIIDGVDTMSVNSEIYTDYKAVMDRFDREGPQYDPGPYAFEQSNAPLSYDYEYYKGDVFVSVKVSSYDAECSGPSMGYFTHGRVYNMSTLDGHKLTNEEMMDLLGISEDDYLAKAKKSITEYWNELTADYTGSTKTWSDEMLQKNLSYDTLSNAQFYVNSEGKIQYLLNIMYIGGSGSLQFIGDLGMFGGTSTVKEEQTTPAPEVQSAQAKLYKQYLQDKLIPQYGWVKERNNPFYSWYGEYDKDGKYGGDPWSNPTKVTYYPSEDYIDSAGILSVDIDDYNGDGTDDMLVTCIYKESTNGMELGNNDSSYIYRTKLMAFTVSANKVVKTDEIDVMSYNTNRLDESQIGCMLSHELDWKKTDIYKVLNGKTPALLCYSMSSNRALEKDASWLMGINKYGKFYMMSYYSNLLYPRKSRYVDRYIFTNGTESSHDEFVYNIRNDVEDHYDLSDFYDERNIAYDQNSSGLPLETAKQILIAAYDFSCDIDYDTSSGRYRYAMTLVHTDGGNLSQSVKQQ